MGGGTEKLAKSVPKGNKGEGTEVKMIFNKDGAHVFEVKTTPEKMMDVIKRHTSKGRDWDFKKSNLEPCDCCGRIKLYFKGKSNLNIYASTQG